MNSNAPLLCSIKNTLRLILAAILLLIASQQPNFPYTPFFESVTVICMVAAGLAVLAVAGSVAVRVFHLLAGTTIPKDSPPKSGDLP